MSRGCLTSSPNTRRSSEMARVNTSSLTNVSDHAARIRRSLGTTWSPCSARHSKTCITLGSRRTVPAGPLTL